MNNLNRLSNTRNPFQGDYKKVLCVCSAGLLRSPTAANVLQATYGFNTRAVGYSGEYALIKLNEVQIYWADELVLVHPSVKEEVDYLFENVKVYQNVDKVVLNIPDKYEFMNHDLKKMILKQYEDAEMIRGVVTDE